MADQKEETPEEKKTAVSVQDLDKQKILLDPEVKNVLVIERPAHDVSE